MTAENRLAQEDREHFVLGCFPNSLWKQLGYLLQEFNPEIMVPGIPSYQFLLHASLHRNWSKAQWQRWVWDYFLCDAQKSFFWCDSSDTATQGCCTGHPQLLLTHRFPPSHHFPRWLFLCSCGLLLPKPRPDLSQRVQSCSQPEGAGLTPDPDLTLLRQSILVPLTATFSNPAVIFTVLQFSRPFFPLSRHAQSSLWLQAQPPREKPDICSGGKQLQRNSTFFYPCLFLLTSQLLEECQLISVPRGLGDASQLCSSLPHRQEAVQPDAFGERIRSSLKGSQPLFSSLRFKS